jgi:hypothetical protein
MSDIVSKREITSVHFLLEDGSSVWVEPDVGGWEVWRTRPDGTGHFPMNWFRYRKWAIDYVEENAHTWLSMADV